jgi:protein MpaA
MVGTGVPPLRDRTLLMPVIAVLGIASTCGCGNAGPHLGRAPIAAANAPEALRRSVVLGRSVRGRPIVAVHLGDPDSGRRLLVMGAIHGDEAAGIAIARLLARGPVPSDLDLWIITSLNPDGVAAGTRQDGRGVDLNRNFPYHWRPLGRPGSARYAGPRALSEPESRLVWRLIRRLRPAVTIWFHQPLGLVDISGGRADLERRYARLAGLSVRRLARYPGSVAGWQNHAIVGSTAFVVELPSGLLPPARASRLGAAAIALAASAGPLGPAERTEGSASPG